MEITIPKVSAETKALMGVRFHPIKVIGSGHFGEATLVIDTEDEVSQAEASLIGGGSPAYKVVKRLKKATPQLSGNEIANIRSEVANLSRISHPNVVRLHESWFELDCHFHMLVEHCGEGDLTAFLKANYPLPEDTVRSLCIQLLLGLDAIHQARMMHRDIKAQNIFLSKVKVGTHDDDAHDDMRPYHAHASQFLVVDHEGQAIVPKFGDFGLSKSLQSTDERAATITGTPHYFSPEIASKRPYSIRSDVWSLGVLFYSILTGTMPFMGSTLAEVCSAIVNKPAAHPADSYFQKHHKEIPYSDALIDIVMEMLTKEESDRPTTDVLLERPYFGGAVKSMRPALARRPYVGAIRTLSLARDGAKVHVRAGPSTRHPIIASLKFRDEIDVSSFVTDEDGVDWWAIMAPMKGYCIRLHQGKVLFITKRSGEHPLRLSPLRRKQQMANNDGGLAVKLLGIGGDEDDGYVSVSASSEDSEAIDCWELDLNVVADVGLNMIPEVQRALLDKPTEGRPIKAKPSLPPMASRLPCKVSPKAKREPTPRKGIVDHRMPPRKASPILNLKDASAAANGNATPARFRRSPGVPLPVVMAVLASDRNGRGKCPVNYGNRSPIPVREKK